MSQLQILIDHGWKWESAIPYHETIAKKAAECLTFSNAINSKMGFLYFTEDASICIRLSTAEGNKFNYFRIQSNDMAQTLNKLVALQDTADANNYFGFYLDMQSVCEISILAWEQWEPNYR